MKKLSLNLHSNGEHFYVNDKDHNNTETISASDIVSFISKNISNKEQKSSLTISLYACYSSLEVDSEKGSLLSQVTQGLIDEGFSGIKITGSKGVTVLTTIPGEHTVKFSEDNDLEYTVTLPSPTGSLNINSGYEGNGNEKYSKSDKKDSIYI